MSWFSWTARPQLVGILSSEICPRLCLQCEYPLGLDGYTLSLLTRAPPIQRRVGYDVCDCILHILDCTIQEHGLHLYAPFCPIL